MGGRASVTRDQFWGARHQKMKTPVELVPESELHSVHVDLMRLHAVEDRLAAAEPVDPERRLEYLRLIDAQIRECRAALDLIETELKAAL